MIKEFFVTGDCHGDMTRFLDYTSIFLNPEKIAYILLGDAGLNYYGGHRDYMNKRILENTKATYYLVRGNHEMRPEHLRNIISMYDENIHGEIWMEPEFPTIRYLKDGGIYTFGDFKALVIGGAYSVDKYYRLSRGWHWFEDEQLTTDELNAIKKQVSGQSFDMILSHTCPIDWEPTDMFLSMIDQSTVEKTMENALADIRDAIQWKRWFFGHFHADRWERPGVQMLFNSIEPLSDMMHRWENDDWKYELHLKSPHFYMGV